MNKESMVSRDMRCYPIFRQTHIHIYIIIYNPMVVKWLVVVTIYFIGLMVLDHWYGVHI